MVRFRERCTLPAVGSSNPTRMRSKEVFPTPFGPTMAMRAPRGMLRVAFQKISSGPNDLATSFAVISDMLVSRVVVPSSRPEVVC